MQKFNWAHLDKLSPSKNHLTPSKASWTAVASIILPTAGNNTWPLEPQSYTAIASPGFSIAAASISL